MTPVLDTSGCVPSPTGGWREFEGLSHFAQGCIEGLFETVWNTPSEKWFGNARGGKPAAFSMLSPYALAQVLSDCELVQPRDPKAFAPEMLRRMGAEFWRQRQSYPRGWRYSDTKTFFPFTVYLNSDGKVDLS